jgi:hypothetical protein
MREIGRITQVQIQQSSLKIGERPNRVYDPSPLLVVDSLLLSPDGVIGLTADGGKIVDVHNATHPDTHNNGGVNDISFGFTSFYHEIRARFGEHLSDGIAGENILIEAEIAYSLEALGTQLVIESQVTGQMIILSNLIVAAPCVEFSQYAVGQASPAQMKETLQFLDNGRRGFYCTLADSHPKAIVQAGDRVLA